MNVDRASLVSVARSETAKQRRAFEDQLKNGRVEHPAPRPERRGVLGYVLFLLRREWWMYKASRRNGKLPVTAITQRMLTIAGQWIEMAEQFAWAHAGGVVTHRVRDLRSSHCVTCVHRVLIRGVRYCNAKECGCPKNPWWPFSKMGWWLWLANVKCPAGRWQGSHVEPLPTVPLTLRGRSLGNHASGPRRSFEAA